MTRRSSRSRPRLRGNPAEWVVHSAQADVLQSDARFLVLPAGRRWGKTEAGVMWMLRGARDDHLRGIGGVSWIVVPTFPVGRPIWRKIQRIAPSGWITDTRGTEFKPDALVIGTSVVEFRSAEHPETLVAEGLRRLWVNEAGIIKEQAWTESLLPTLVDHKAPALVEGTPKGRNWFHALHVQAQDPLEPDVAAFGGSSYQNPFIDADEIKRLGRHMSSRLYRQEILAEFLDDEGAVFRGHRQCVGPMALGPAVVLGVDLGKRQDFTVLHGITADAKTCHWDRMNEVSWPLQKARIGAAWKTLGQPLVVIDWTGIGDPIVDDLVAAGIKVHGVRFTNAVKQQLVEGLCIAIEQKEIGLPDEPVLLNELDVFEYETTRGGLTRYNAPEGLHDDAVIAAALAWHGMALRERYSVPDLEPVHW